MKLEKTVYDVVVAVAADYERMQKRIGSGELSREQLDSFVRKVCAIDHALAVVCEGERDEVKRALLIDIGERRGFDRAISRNYYTTRKIFGKRKGQAVNLIARMLDLI